MATDVRTWIDAYAAALGVAPLPDADVGPLLELAGAAAHAAERTAAPLSCWLAATAGVTPTVALEQARALAASFAEDDPD
ncbi:MAG: DUF6457 domain-containing protein [Actinomycetota bacterium]|jgi:hypothetical protein|nr:DUF6457 domain-containing protein [Actinomycetota bacterium]